MKGNIYTSQKCPVCRSVMVHNERKNNCFCRECNYPASKGYFVRFGRKICKRFQSYAEAAQFLNGIRFKTAEGTFDRRDYQKDNPLGFANQADKWLEIKKLEIKKRSWNNLNNYMQKAIDDFGNINIKLVRYKKIQKFLYGPSFKNDKTRANACSCLRDFFAWVQDCEEIKSPKLPVCKFVLGLRNVTDWETQEIIIDKVKDISYQVNPKIWFGIVLLATYTALRPDDLRRINEADFNPQYGIITIHKPTKSDNNFKIIRLVPEHAEIWSELKSKHPGLPHMPFFRHIGGIPGTAPDSQFGPKYFKVWWDKACKIVGLSGVDLYGGTRHTTTTELARVAGQDNAKKASGHLTNKAFARYCQAQDETAFQMAKIVIDKRKPAEVISFERKER